MNQNINILHIVFSLRNGGLEKVVMDLASSTMFEGSKSIVCCLDEYGEMADDLRMQGVEVILAGRKPGIEYSLPFRLAKTMKDKDISIVHTHNTGPLFYGTLGAKLAGVPVIMHTRHNRENKVGNKLIWSLICSMNDQIITISKDARKQFLNYVHVNEEKVKVILNGIDVSRFVDMNTVKSKRKELSVDPTDTVIGTVARLSPEKDQKTLLDAFALVSRQVEKVKLIIVGDGKQREFLEIHAKSLEVTDKVMFLGYRKDIPKLLAGIDIFVLASLTEGISISLLEAMAAGKPVVATNVGGNPEVVIDDKTGILVPPRNPRILADAIIRLVNDHALCSRMGKSGQKQVSEKYSFEKMAQEYRRQYMFHLKKKNLI